MLESFFLGLTFYGALLLIGQVTGFLAGRRILG